MRNSFFSFLVGKTISYYDSFSGSHSYFQISTVEDCDNSIRVRPDREGHWGAFIPKKYLGELLTSGKYTYSYSLEGCALKEEWKLYE